VKDPVEKDLGFNPSMDGKEAATTRSTSRSITRSFNPSMDGKECDEVMLSLSCRNGNSFNPSMDGKEGSRPRLALTLPSTVLILVWTGKKLVVYFCCARPYRLRFNPSYGRKEGSPIS